MTPDFLDAASLHIWMHRLTRCDLARGHPSGEVLEFHAGAAECTAEATRRTARERAEYIALYARLAEHWISTPLTEEG
jgi:hypothetical protein